MVKIFTIGGTGHTGGAILDILQRTHPDVPIRALVRSEDKAARLRAAYPAVEPVIGSLTTLDVLAAEARGADIVVNTAPDITHDAGIAAVLAGLRERTTRGYYVHCSGAATFYSDQPDGRRGGRVWDDVADVRDILATESAVTHVVTDNLVRDAASAGVNVAIVSPPGIGGVSPSPEHPFPLGTSVFVSTARAFGSGFQIGSGENELSMIHVMDLARAFVLLVERALAELGQEEGGAAPVAVDFPVWGREAYYFAQSEDIAFRDMQKALVASMNRLGVISSSDIVSLDHVSLARTIIAGGREYDPDAPLPNADSWIIHMAVGFASNMRVRASKLRLLGWEPKEASVLEAWDEAIAEFLRREKAAQAENSG